MTAYGFTQFLRNFFLAKEARPMSPVPNRSIVAGSGMVTKLPFSSVSAAIAIAAVSNNPPAIKKSARRDLTILSFALDALFRLLVLV